jgi:hypothetical protein
VTIIIVIFLAMSIRGTILEKALFIPVGFFQKFTWEDGS